MAAYTVNTSNGNLATVFTPIVHRNESGGPNWRSFTEYATTRPIITRIPTQFVQEGFTISFPLSSYVNGATSYRLGPLTAVQPTNAPLFPIEITSNGTVRGSGTSLTAPFVRVDSYYSTTLYAGNAAGESSQVFQIAVLNGVPVWGCCACSVCG